MFDNTVLDLCKQKGVSPYKYKCDFEKFEEELPSKEKLYNWLTGKKNSNKEYEHLLNI